MATLLRSCCFPVRLVHHAPEPVSTHPAGTQIGLLKAFAPHGANRIAPKLRNFSKTSHAARPFMGFIAAASLMAKLTTRPDADNLISRPRAVGEGQTGLGWNFGGRSRRYLDRLLFGRRDRIR